MALVAASYMFWRRRFVAAWVCVLLTLAWGDVSATWIIGLGVTLALAGALCRAERVRLAVHGLACVVAGVVWLSVVSRLGGTAAANVSAKIILESGHQGSAAAHPSILALASAMVAHPSVWMDPLWGHRLNIFATIAPAGVLGAFSSWTVGIAGIVLTEGNIVPSELWSTPSFQQIPLAALTAVGAVLVISWGAARWSTRSQRALRITWAVIGILGINALGWGLVWIPQLPSQWLRTSSTQAGLLASVRSRIPLGDEVVAANGVVGAFAQRPQIYDWGGVVPVKTRTVWFVVPTQAGIEYPPEQSLEAINYLVSDLHAQVIDARSGIFVLRWEAPAGTRTVSTTGTQAAAVLGWTVAGAAGAPRLIGPSSSWQAVATGQPGYIVSGDYWLRPPGRYTFRVRMSASRPFAIEVWDVRAGILIARDAYVASGRNLNLSIPVIVTARPNLTPPYSGLGPFSITPVPPPPGQVLELRVVNPGGTGLGVSSITLRAG